MAGDRARHDRSRRRVSPGNDAGRLRLPQDARPLLRGAAKERPRRRAARTPPPARQNPSRGGTPARRCHRTGARMSRATFAQREPMQKRLFIKTYGCQMNVYDSARMADLMAPLGYAPVASADGADLVILNTCHIREKAAEKVFSELGAIRRLKGARARQGGRMLVAVAGCVAQAEGDEIQRRAPFVDIVFGPQAYHRLPEMVGRALDSAGAGILATRFTDVPTFDYLPESAAAPGVSAFLTVQEGCDKFCTF